MVYDLDGEVWVILGEGEVIIRLAATLEPDETLTYIGPAEKPQARGIRKSGTSGQRFQKTR